MREILGGGEVSHQTHCISSVARGGQTRGEPAVLSTRRSGRAGIDTDPESTNQEHVMTFMLIRKAGCQAEAYNGGSGQ